MSRFATVNLLDVEDSIGDRAPGIEVRFGRNHLDSRDLGISHFRYAPNLRSPMAHSHREQEEAYVVVAGSAGCCSTTRSSSCASGTSCASRPRSCARSRPVPTGSTSSPSAAPSPRAATA